MSTYWVNEKVTARYSAIIQDETETALAGSNLQTLTLTLYDKATGTIINSRNDQDVLNTNGVSVDGSGNVVWIMEPEDNAVVTATSKVEKHIALFEWTWDSGNKEGRHEVVLQVKNLTKVT
jgi:hypothetical protein